MQTKKDIGILAIAILAIAGIIGYLEYQKPMRSNTDAVELPARASLRKSALYPVARELAGIEAYINTNSEPIALADLVGKKVILLDIWTYSCINCQRTLPYITTWYEKYKDLGLEIIGVHTPEFDFEKKYDNVLAATKKFDIEYPVVLDNAYATWNAYNNRYWPRKYLIDIDGYVVYDHIGEGGYEETEKKIQELLRERADKLSLDVIIDSSISEVRARRAARGVASPETYFGAFRNELLANGTQRTAGVQALQEPEKIQKNQLYLVGGWNIWDQYAQPHADGARVIYRYTSKDVYLVAAAETEQQLGVVLDGVKQDSVSVLDETLYTVINGDRVGEHVLELIVPAGVKLYAFTFG